jgi:hypothetical protein
VDHLLNYAIPAYRFIKKGIFFCEKNAILAFRAIIIS